MTNTDNIVTQLPGTLNLDMVVNNDFVFNIDWHTDLTGYTFAAYIIPENSDAEIAMTVNVLDIAAGTMQVVITEASITDLPDSINKWYFNWTTPAPDSYVRTVLVGALVLRAK